MRRSWLSLSSSVSFLLCALTVTGCELPIELSACADPASSPPAGRGEGEGESSGFDGGFVDDDAGGEGDPGSEGEGDDDGEAVPCDLSLSCAEGLTCVEGSCIAIAHECAEDTDCTEGQVCSVVDNEPEGYVEATCTPPRQVGASCFFSDGESSSETSCAAGLMCVAVVYFDYELSVCAVPGELPESAACQTDDECAADACVEGRCADPQ